MEKGFFPWVLLWGGSENGFIRLNDSGTPELRRFWGFAERLIDVGLVRDLPDQVTGSPAPPVWSLVHLDDQHRSFWCFVEQGWDPGFGEAGGCRFSITTFDHHPADVWRAGSGLALVRPVESARPGATTPSLGPPPRSPSRLATAADVLAGIALGHKRMRLPGTPDENASLIQDLLTVLPRRVAAGWVWSTCLFGVAPRFVAGRPPEHLRHDHLDHDQEDGTIWTGTDLPVARARELLGGRWAATVDLARHLGRVPPAVNEAVRDSKATELNDLLDTLPPVVPPPNVPPPPVAQPPQVAAVAASITGADHVPTRRIDLSPPATASPAPRPQTATDPLIWVQWADAGNGFARLGDDGEPRLRPYWMAAESLLESEKVPQGVDQTLAHPLWNLRRVHVDGIGPSWCFVERGRGIRVGENGKPRQGRQFGIAGGCRFGFADFQRPPLDVWRAGAAQAWTPVTSPPMRYPDAVAGLLAGITVDQDRIRLPGTPAANVFLIDQLLAVLPREVAARWLWSTCLFRWTDRFVGAPAPADLQTAAFARLAARLAEVPPGTRADLVQRGLSTRQAASFSRLLLEAQRAGTISVTASVRNVLRESRAEALPDALDEMADRIRNLRPMPIQDVPTELLSKRGAEVLHEQYPDETREWARSDPAQARHYLVDKPDSAAAPDVLAGLLDAQRADPTKNLLGVPTSAAPHPAGLDQITRLLVRLEPDLGLRAGLVTRLTAPGALLCRFDNLAAAAPWLRDLHLTPESHPWLFPAHLVDLLAQRTGVSRETAVVLRRVFDPVDVTLRAVCLIRQPTAEHATRLLLSLYIALGQRPDLAKAPFGSVVAAVLQRSGKRNVRQRLLADMVDLADLHAPSDTRVDFCREVLLNGGRALSRADKSRPVWDTRLWQQSVRLRLASTPGDTLFRPAPVQSPAGHPGRRSAQSISDRLRAIAIRRRRRGLVIVAAALVLGVATAVVRPTIFDIGFLSSAKTPTPNEDPRTVSGFPPGNPSTRSGPVVRNPNSASITVVWQHDRDSQHAVEEIGIQIDLYQKRQIVHVTLIGYAAAAETARDAAESVREALNRAALPALAGVPIDASFRVTATVREQGRVVILIDFAD